jgi:GNAT superfamily N-acetyltransferase
METAIRRRPLTDQEINRLDGLIRNFPDLTYFGPSRWRSYTRPYCISVDGEFAGVLAADEFDGWVKLGPLVILPARHGRGLATQLVAAAIRDYPHTPIVIVSSNPVVRHMAENYGFAEVRGFIALPGAVRQYLIRQLWGFFAVPVVREYVRKFFRFGRGRIAYFVRRPADIP